MPPGFVCPGCICEPIIAIVDRLLPRLPFAKFAIVTVAGGNDCDLTGIKTATGSHDKEFQDDGCPNMVKLCSQLSRK
jgi:hypothetical protein